MNYTYCLCSDVKFDYTLQSPFIEFSFYTLSLPVLMILVEYKDLRVNMTRGYLKHSRCWKIQTSLVENGTDGIMLYTMVCI